MRRVFPLLVGFLVFGGCDCGDDDVMDMDGDVPMGDGSPGDDLGTCVGRGGDCSADTDCCEGPCTAGVCEMGCGALGIDCAAGTDCCSGVCEANVCAPDACVDLGGSCATNSNCCTGFCDAGSCAMPPDCDATGAACSDNCCSGRCADEGGTGCSPGDAGCLCAPPAECRASGETCSMDSECCNRLCDDPDGDGDGTCANPGQCLPAGEPCGTEGYNGSCCSTVCLDTTGTGARCQFLGGCRVQDELCSTDSECCSGECRESGTTADGRPINRCANVISCLPVGEVCGGMGGSSNCCPDGGGREGCFETGTGFSRCLGGDGSCVPPSMECTDDPENCCTDAYPTIDCRPATDERADATRVYCCLNDGEECAFGDVCCGGVCAPDGDGVLRCGATCVDDGGACTVDSDCCGCGCVDGACTSDEALCDPCTGPQLGELCTPDGEPCCNSPTVTCSGGEFPTCTIAG